MHNEKTSFCPPRIKSNIISKRTNTNTAASFRAPRRDDVCCCPQDNQDSPLTRHRLSCCRRKRSSRSGTPRGPEWRPDRSGPSGTVSTSSHRSQSTSPVGKKPSTPRRGEVRGSTSRPGRRCTSWHPRRSSSHRSRRWAGPRGSRRRSRRDTPCSSGIHCSMMRPVELREGTVGVVSRGVERGWEMIVIPWQLGRGA